MGNLDPRPPQLHYAAPATANPTCGAGIHAKCKTQTCLVSLQRQLKSHVRFAVDNCNLPETDTARVGGFSAFCRASAELSQEEIDRTARDGGFAELLRLRLVATLGRAARLEPPVGDEGPALKLRDDQPKLPTGRVKKRPTQQPRRRRPAPVALPVPPASSKTRRLQRARKALNDAMTEVATDKDDA